VVPLTLAAGACLLLWLKPALVPETLIVLIGGAVSPWSARSGWVWLLGFNLRRRSVGRDDRAGGIGRETGHPDVA